MTNIISYDSYDSYYSYESYHMNKKVILRKSLVIRLSNLLESVIFSIFSREYSFNRGSDQTEIHSPI